MKTPVRTGTDRDNDDLAMTSMIDVVFLLLIFFVWTSSFDLPETNLPGSIAMAPEPVETEVAGGPTPQTALQETSPTEIIVRIIDDPGGQSYRVGAVELSNHSALQKKLSTIASLPVDMLVIIDPDPEISVADTIKVFDLARSLKFPKVLLAVEPAS